MTKIEITTSDGRCPAYVFRPNGEGPWPGALVFMDGIGIRPAMLEIAARLASHGYYVLLPDLYWRAGPYEPMDAKTIFTDPDGIKKLRETFFPHASADKMMRDTQAFLDHFAAQKDVKQIGIGTTGYCMGGRLSLVAATTYPDRIVAAAAYHPGGLVTDAPDSPHRLVEKIRAKVYVAGATDDQNFTDEQRSTLADALAKAGVDHVVEKYPARHGGSRARRGLRRAPLQDAPRALRIEARVIASSQRRFATRCGARAGVRRRSPVTPRCSRCSTARSSRACSTARAERAEPGRAAPRAEAPA